MRELDIGNDGQDAFAEKPVKSSHDDGDVNVRFFRLLASGTGSEQVEPDKRGPKQGPQSVLQIGESGIDRDVSGLHRAPIVCSEGPPFKGEMGKAVTAARG